MTRQPPSPPFPRNIWFALTLALLGLFTACEDTTVATDPAPVEPAPVPTVAFAQVGSPVITVVEFTGNPSRDASGSGDFNAYDTYVVGDEIRIDVKFNEPVVVTGGGDVRLRLDLGTDDATPGNSRRTLTHPRMFNGGRTMRFSYAVTSSDLDPDGVWVQTDASNRVVFEPHDDQRVVSAASCADTCVNADLTKSGLPTTGNPKKMVDGSASASGPRPSSATVDGKTATLIFDSVLDKSYANNFDLGFFFSLQGGYSHIYGGVGVNQHARAVSVSDSTVTLTFSRGALAGETVTLNYWYMDPMRPLRDTIGNFAPPIQDFPVTNVTGGAAGPVPVRSWLDGSSLRIRFAGDLDESSQPAGSAFQVRTEDPDGNGRAIAGTDTASVTGSEVAVTLAALDPNEKVVRASYAKPSANPLRGGGGDDVRSFDSLYVAPTYVGPPLTASFHGLPKAHDGARLFGFQIVFSEEFEGLRLTAFEAGALEVTNGRLVDVKRVTQGENRRVAVRVRPSSGEEMTLTLPGTTDCAAAGAICADDGRMLSGPVSATVTGPPLTAEFKGMPSTHNGKKLFGFVIVFSEEFEGLTLTGLKKALAVTNGRIVDVKRVTRGENRRVAVRVRPTSNDDITITLPAGSVSTASGRPLANTVSATVVGPGSEGDP